MRVRVRVSVRVHTFICTYLPMQCTVNKGTRMWTYPQTACNGLFSQSPVFLSQACYTSMERLEGVVICYACYTSMERLEGVASGYQQHRHYNDVALEV